MAIILTRDAILQAKDRKMEKVSVPEWGGEVFVRSLSGAERDSYEASIVIFHGQTQEINVQNMRAKLVALTACDAEGKRLFTDEDIAVLSEKSAAALQRLFTVAQQLSGLTKRDVDELVDGLKKGRSDGSTSD